MREMSPYAYPALPRISGWWGWFWAVLKSQANPVVTASLLLAWEVLGGMVGRAWLPVWAQSCTFLGAQDEKSCPWHPSWSRCSCFRKRCSAFTGASVPTGVGNSRRAWGWSQSARAPLAPGTRTLLLHNLIFSQKVIRFIVNSTVGL